MAQRLLSRVISRALHPIADDTMIDRTMPKRVRKHVLDCIRIVSRNLKKRRTS